MWFNKWTKLCTRNKDKTRVVHTKNDNSTNNYKYFILKIIVTSRQSTPQLQQRWQWQKISLGPLSEPFDEWNINSQSKSISAVL